ncbi:MAG: 16S rRNA (guanine(966)-N(2))-methyltransferase RsmD [Firmicutes bacterium]|nr:16S rRNA (guanine(966)-N(2))-methyltransferase RsmD [Bacillota bacterium]
MRVISGKYKGKQLVGFDIDGTRPTQDRVKESLFAMIQEYLVDACVLDLFAGSGNLGIEALSNGASSCVFVDINKKCIQTISKNVETLKEDIEIIQGDYRDTILKMKNRKFDIIFLDPPYRYGIIEEIINLIIQNNLLSDEGIIVCEYEKDDLNDNYGDLFMIKNKKYGYKNITIYQKGEVL